MMTSERESCLSLSVRHLICEAGVSSEVYPECLDEKGLLNWNAVGLVMLEEKKDVSKYFVDSVTAMAPTFHTIHSHFVELDSDGYSRFMETFTEYTGWTSSPSLVLSLAMKLCQYKLDNNEEILEWFLLYFPLLERSLGDLYLCKGRQCPSMLKDLLMTEELRTLLSPTVIKLLRVIIGPPISLNLRNVVWHGFPTPGEIPMQYTYFLLCLLPSIGQLLAENGLSPEDIVHREFLVLPEIQQEMSECIVDVVDRHIDEFIDMVHKSDIVLSANKPMWKLAIRRFHASEYGQCATILLPQLEHYLRCLFAKMNNCPDRILTAESSAFFTTFDEVLVEVLPDGNKNRLLEIVKDNTLDCLLDLLHYPEGPRIRDKLSHGEINLETFAKKLACHIIVVCGALLNWNSKDNCGTFALTKYDSVFHPVSLLRQELLRSTSCLNDWLSMQRPTVDEIECTYNWNDHETFSDIEHSLVQSLKNIEGLYNINASKIGINIFGDDFKGRVEQWISPTHVVTAFRYFYLTNIVDFLVRLTKG